MPQDNVTASLFHCVFNPDASITHFTHEVDGDLCRNLPYLYVVSVADNSAAPRRLVAACIVKTHLLSTDEGFLDSIGAIVDATPELAVARKERHSLLCVRVNGAGDGLLGEQAMLEMVMHQFITFSSAGSA